MISHSYKEDHLTADTGKVQFRSLHYTLACIGCCKLKYSHVPDSSCYITNKLPYILWELWSNNCLVSDLATSSGLLIAYKGEEIIVLKYGFCQRQQSWTTFVFGLEELRADLIHTFLCHRWVAYSAKKKKKKKKQNTGLSMLQKTQQSMGVAESSKWLCAATLIFNTIPLQSSTWSTGISDNTVVHNETWLREIHDMKSQDFESTLCCRLENR